MCSPLLREPEVLEIRYATSIGAYMRSARSVLVFLAISTLMISVGCASPTYRNLQYMVRRELPKDPEQRLAMSYCADVAHRQSTRANALAGTSAGLGAVALGGTALWIAAANEDAKTSSIEESIGMSLSLTAGVAALALLIPIMISAEDGDSAARAAVQIRGEESSKFELKNYGSCEARPAPQDGK